MNRVYSGIIITVILVLLISIIIATNSPSYNPDLYCKLPSCKGKPHSLCIYPSRPNLRCGKCYQKGLTQAEKNAVLKLHNELRQKVARGQEKRGSNGPQPAAKSGSMPNMVWSRELEIIAQKWAQQCLPAHDKCRDTPSMRVGQNAASETNSRPEDIKPTKMVMRWYDEVANFDAAYVKKYQSVHGTGHYTQLVWANSKQLGCGYVKCDQGRMHHGQLACNYGPAGNFIGQPIYET